MIMSFVMANRSSTGDRGQKAGVRGHRKTLIPNASFLMPGYPHPSGLDDGKLYFLSADDAQFKGERL
jgi:hypothetical protein